jgi:hypothetical protein
MNKNIWLKMVEYEVICKRLNGQVKRIKDRIQQYALTNNLDETIEPEKMSDLINDFIESENKRLEEERKRKSKLDTDIRLKKNYEKREYIKNTPKKEIPPKSLEFQLGLKIGEEIVERDLVSLSNEPNTRNVVVISTKEQVEYERLSNAWYAASEALGDEGSKKEWKDYRNYASYLQKKYLPPVLECYISKIESVNNMEDIKKGIRLALCDSDVCNYDTTRIDIVPEDGLLNWYDKVIIYLEKPEENDKRTIS